MQSFDELSRNERIKRYEQLGLVALERYGIRQPPIWIGEIGFCEMQWSGADGILNSEQIMFD